MITQQKPNGYVDNYSELQTISKLGPCGTTK